jgi:hypothetical protein
VKKVLHMISPLLFIVIPIAIQFFYIYRFSVNVPWWDEWAFVDLLQAWARHDFGKVVTLLWAQHNEHRPIFPRLIMLILANFTGWDVRIEMYFGLLLSTLLLVVIGLVYNKTVGNFLWLFVPLAWLVFSLGQWENILWGWQIAFYLQTLATLGAIYLLSIRSLRSTIFAALCAVVASFSSIGGLLSWPAGMLYLLAQKAYRKRLLLWGVVGTLTITAYFIGYVPPQHHPSTLMALSQPVETVLFFLTNVGAPLGGGSLLFSRAMGICLFLFLLVYLCQRLREAGVESVGAEILPISMVIVSLFHSAVIALGRVGFGHPDLAMSSRYITFASVGIAGEYILFAQYWVVAKQVDHKTQQFSSSLLSVLLSIMLVGLAASNLYGLQQGRALHASRLHAQHVLRTFEIQPDEALTVLFINPMFVRERAKFLQEWRFSVFRESRALLLSRTSGWSGEEVWGVWAEGLSSEAILWTADLADLRLLLEAFPYCVPGQHQAITVTINNTLIAHHVWQDCSPWSAQISIPSSLLKKGKNMLRFSFAYAARPVDVTQGQNGDTRWLSVGFSKMEVKKP